MYETISETVAAYDSMLDEIYPTVQVDGLEWAPSEVLEKTDPIAYKCGWVDWCDAEGIDTDELEDDYTFESDRNYYSAE